MGKSTHFIGQPVLGQLIKCIGKEKILKISRAKDGERYVKSFDAWQHLVVMLYAVIMRFDSLREIAAATEAESRKLSHLGITSLPRRSTLSDANMRRPNEVFEEIYRSLYEDNKHILSSDSSSHKLPSWMKHLQIIDSTTISLFSNLIFKGVGRNPKMGKKKGGLKCHTVIHANEGVPYDVCFTSAAAHDHFMLVPNHFNKDDLLALDRAYIDYGKFEELTERGVMYVTKMKKNLVYETISSVYHMNIEGKMVWREEIVVFTKKGKDGKIITHKARIITYADKEKKKLIRLLSNNLEFSYEEIVEIYRKRWAIELLFKQMKQNFPLKYFYGESANAIKIQVWVTLIANLLLTLLQRSVKRSWSFSGLATMVRIMLMHYINVQSLLEHPEKDWEKSVCELTKSPLEPYLFD